MSLRAEVERVGGRFEVVAPSTPGVPFDADAFVKLAQSYMPRALAAGGADSKVIEEQVIEDSWTAELEVR